MFTRDNGRIATIWLPNAFLLAILLRTQNAQIPAFLCAALIANIAGALVAGDSLAIAFGIAVTNMIEVSLVWWIMRRLNLNHPDMMDLRSLVIFCLLGGLLAPSFSGLLALIVLMPESLFSSWTTWVIADGLGILLITPAMLIIGDALKNPRKISVLELAEWILVTVAGILVTVYVFFQTSFPFLFLCTSVVIFSAFRLRSLGTSVSTLVIAIVAVAGTAQGFGPIHLSEGNAAEHMMVLQVFLVSCFAAGLPIAALLHRKDKVEKQLLENGELTESVLNNMREVVFRTDLKGRWIFLNPAWEKLTGYTVKESMGWAATKLIHEDDQAETAQVYQDMLSGKTTECQVEHRFHTANGECRRVHVTVKVLTDSDGQFAGAVGNMHDMTSRHIAEQQLKEAHSTFETLADLSPAGIFRTAANGECTYGNSAWLDLAGLSFEQAAGTGWVVAIHPDDVDRVWMEWGETVASGSKYNSDFRFLHADQTVKWVAAIASPIFNQDGELEGYIGVNVDISDRKDLESDLVSARRHADAAANAKSNFLANMSHEVRTPMNGVLGFAELLLDSDLDGEKRRYVQLISDSGKAMMSLLNNVLDISKIESGKMAKSEKLVDIHHLLEGSLSLMQSNAEQKQLPLSLQIDDSVPQYVVTDGMHLRQIILNLLGNAIKFTYRGYVKLNVSATFEVGQDIVLHISVEDTGIGIDEKRQSAVFNPFEQANEQITSRYGGTGLGLSISKDLAALIGGKLSLISVPGKGSIFSLDLPASLSHQNIEDKSRQITQPSLGRKLTKGIRVLVAEDHDVNQILVRTILENLHCSVDIASDGTQAVAKVIKMAGRKQQYDLVLMDIQMPNLNGYDATKKIRSAGIGSDDLPIIAFTANAYADDIAACLKAGMQGHLAKPVSKTQLTEILEKWTVKSAIVDKEEEKQDQPEISPSLQKLYAQRRLEALDNVNMLIRQGSFTDIEITETASILHKLAGTAGMFGEADLGIQARYLEGKLKDLPANDRREQIPMAASKLLKIA